LEQALRNRLWREDGVGKCTRSVGENWHMRNEIGVHKDQNNTTISGGG
jgi:hypothetical protein